MMAGKLAGDKSKLEEEGLIGTSVVEVYVVNEKGTEFVGDMVVNEAKEMPKEFVFSEYSREPALLQGLDDPKREDLEVDCMESFAGSRGNISRFVAYLKERRKAALVNLSADERWILLPELQSASDGSRFRLAHYSKTKDGRVQKRRRLDETSMDEVVTGKEQNWYTEDVAEAKRLAALVPSWSERSKAAAEQMIFRVPQDGSGRYFQDARKRYEFLCGSHGLQLLASLQKETQKTLTLLDAELSRLESSKRNQLLEEGRRIYAEKPSLRKFGPEAGHNVTWSNDEYAHVGLRAQYLRLKSLQRYTETYNLCERAAGLDDTAKSIFSQSTLRICSLGGGPAFELIALRDFIRKLNSGKPNPPSLNMFSLDLQPAWKPYAESLGVAFRGPFDVTKASPTSLLEACDCTAPNQIIDILVVSYLLIYCTNAFTADLLTSLLTSNKVSMLLISERTHSQDIVQLLLQRGLSVVPLMPQSRWEPDQRQLLVLPSTRAAPVSSDVGKQAAREQNLTFYNVPFAKGT